MTPEDLLQAHIALSSTLRDTHYGHTIPEHTTPPSALEFAKAIGNNTPFVLRGVATSWPAIDPASPSHWSNAHLAATLADDPVTVSLTGDGYADAVTWLSADAERPHRTYPNGNGASGEGQFVLASPCEAQLPFRAVLAHLIAPRHKHGQPRTIAFLQLQNDCLRSREYAALLSSVPAASPAWAAAVLGGAPTALNFWMGTRDSVSSLHADPYENVYTVVRGVKVFTLWPPSDAFFLCRGVYRTARWTSTAKAAEAGAQGVPEVRLVLDEGDGAQMVPWIPITHPRHPAPMYPRFAHAPEPFVVRVCAGDSLYLPKGWLHHVEQEEDEDGLCIAVNAWYEGWEGMGLSWGWGEYAQRMEEMLDKD